MSLVFQCGWKMSHLTHLLLIRQICLLLNKITYFFLQKKKKKSYSIIDYRTNLEIARPISDLSHNHTHTLPTILIYCYNQNTNPARPTWGYYQINVFFFFFTQKPQGCAYCDLDEGCAREFTIISQFLLTLHYFFFLVTQCVVVAGSPTQSPSVNPIIHLRRRKTL